MTRRTNNSVRYGTFLAAAATVLSASSILGAPTRAWAPAKTDLQKLDRPSFFGAFTMRLPKNIRRNGLPTADANDVNTAIYRFTDTKPKPTLNMAVDYIEANPPHESPRAIEDSLLNGIQSAFIRNQPNGGHKPIREYGTIAGISAAREHYRYMDLSKPSVPRIGFAYVASIGDCTIVVGATDEAADASLLKLAETAALTIVRRPGNHRMFSD